MLKCLLFIFTISSSFAADQNFRMDSERTLKVIEHSKQVRADIAKNSKKREVASINSNVIDETGELDAYLANAESELE